MKIACFFIPSHSLLTYKVNDRGRGTQILMLHLCMTRGFQNIPLSRFAFSRAGKTPQHSTLFLYLIYINFKSVSSSLFSKNTQPACLYISLIAWFEHALCSSLAPSGPKPVSIRTQACLLTERPVRPTNQPTNQPTQYYPLNKIFWGTCLVPGTESLKSSPFLFFNRYINTPNCDSRESCLASKKRLYLMFLWVA